MKITEQEISAILETYRRGWVIEERIGRGASSRVYRIRHDQMTSALKVIELLPREGESAEDVQREISRITAEIRTMEDLRDYSKNIVRIDDFQVLHRRDGTYVVLLFMELLDPVPDYFARTGIRVREVVRMGMEICSALSICVSRYGGNGGQFVHSDIKPANLFHDRYGNFKLGDFGISRTVYSGDQFARGAAGTFAYLPPEELVRHQTDPQTADLYSLGIVLYQYLNDGRIPFCEERRPDREVQRKALVHRNQNEPIPLPCDAPPELGEVILRAIRFAPQERYQSPEEFRRALGDWMASSHVAPGAGQSLAGQSSAGQGKVSPVPPATSSAAAASAAPAGAAVQAPAGDAAPAAQGQRQGLPRKRGGRLLAVLAAAVLAVLVILHFFGGGKQEVTVSFDGNGASGTMEEITVEQGETFTLPPGTFSRPGYVFVGWSCTDSAGKTHRFKDQDSLTTQEDLTLKARWQESAGAIKKEMKASQESVSWTDADGKVRLWAVLTVTNNTQQTMDVTGTFSFQNEEGKSVDTQTASLQGLPRGDTGILLVSSTSEEAVQVTCSPVYARGAETSVPEVFLQEMTDTELKVKLRNSTDHDLEGVRVNAVGRDADGQVCACVQGDTLSLTQSEEVTISLPLTGLPEDLEPSQLSWSCSAGRMQ